MQFAVFDIEAANWTKYVVGGYYDGNRNLFRHFGKLDAFFKFLETDYLGPQTIFAHFGGIYDFLFLLRHAYSHGYRVGTIIPRGSGILAVEIRIGKRKYTFRDSSALLPFSLRRLTDAFQVETKKGEIDYETIRKITPELLDYLRSDCLGLWQVLDRFYATEFIAEVGPAITIASQAVRVMRGYLDSPLHSISDEVDEFVRRGYFGGRTEIYKPLFTGPGKLHCYDVNSLYPTMMREQEFPNKFKKWTKKMGDSSLGYYEAKVTVPNDTYLPILPVVTGKEKKLLFPTGTFRGTWSSLELRYAEEQGATIERIYSGAEFFNGGYLFRDFVDSVYKIRQTSAKNSVDNYVAKLILNSCYGKLAIRREKENIRSVETLEDFYSGEPWREIRCGKKNIHLVKQKTRLEGFSNVAMGAWVTAAGRIHMHRIMNPIQDSIYYMDTDSIFTTKKLPTSAGLGSLKFEYSVDRACFLLPKTYLVEGDETKIVMKGFDGKKIKHFTFQDFHSTLNGEMGLLKTEGEKRFAKFKTSSRKGKLLIMEERSGKQVRSRYDKRILLKPENNTGLGSSWDSKPVEVKHGTEEKTEKKQRASTRLSSMHGERE